MCVCVGAGMRAHLAPLSRTCECACMCVGEGMRAHLAPLSRTCECACMCGCRYACSPSPSVSNMYSSRTFMLRHHVRKFAMLSRANQVPDRALLLHFGAEFGISWENTQSNSENTRSNSDLKLMWLIRVLQFKMLSVCQAKTILP